MKRGWDSGSPSDFDGLELVCNLGVVSSILALRYLFARLRVLSHEFEGVNSSLSPSQLSGPGGPDSSYRAKRGETISRALARSRGRL